MSDNNAAPTTAHLIAIDSQYIPGILAEVLTPAPIATIIRHKGLFLMKSAIPLKSSDVNPPTNLSF